MALGDRIVSLALVEESGSFAPDAITTKVEVPGRLEGVKRFVRDAASPTRSSSRRGAPAASPSRWFRATGRASP